MLCGVDTLRILVRNYICVDYSGVCGDYYLVETLCLETIQDSTIDALGDCLQAIVSQRSVQNGNQ